jgi:hypothetical protein
LLLYLVLLVLDKLLSSNISWRSNSIAILLHSVDWSISRIWARNDIGIASSQLRVVKLIFELNVVRVNSKCIVKLE